MNLFDQVSDDIKAAMLAKDKIRLQALRGVKKEFLEAKTAKGGNGELSDEAAVKILQKMVKQRKESAEIFKTQGREELAENELAEVAAIELYLPKQMSVEELDAALKEIITQVGAEGPKDMGKVMGAATKALAGKADGRMISDTVKRLLS
ncbi:MAG: GatB/YqeY domain-containing protein [Tannerellaceae bacterium]|nr:GatB/YqeY domain-containing protein [Tannerellaceae bacterium]